MPDFELATCAALLLGFGYLRFGSDVRLKRWVLPLATAAVAALAGLALARSTGGQLVDYAIAVPLAMSGGMILQHLFDFCRQCGNARRLASALRRGATAGGHPAGQGIPQHRCPGCRASGG